jgi:hypothetical protein
VSETVEPNRLEIDEPGDSPVGESMAGDTEEVDALPVLAEGQIVRAYPFAGTPANAPRSVGPAIAAIPAVQAAAVAIGGFVAGAAVVGLAHRRRRQSPSAPKPRRAGRTAGKGARDSRSAGKVGELVQIVGSRSLLVDVHLLGGGE